MITVDQARELIDAINDYGDRERLVGVSEGALHTGKRLAERNLDASMALDVIRGMLRPHIEDPDHHHLHGQYDHPEGA